MIDELITSEASRTLFRSIFWLLVTYYLWIVVLWYFKKPLYLKLWHKKDGQHVFFMLNCVVYAMFWVFEGLQSAIDSSNKPIISTWFTTVYFIVILGFIGWEKLISIRKKIKGAF